MKLLIIENHEIVRKGLMMMLTSEDHFQEIEEASTVEEAMKQLRIQQIDLAIIDINLNSKESGLEVIAKAKEESINTKFLVLTSSSRKTDFEKARCLGVAGYMLKDSSVEDIHYAIKSIVRGKNYYTSELEYGSGNHTLHKEVKSILTDREYEVLQALGKGLTNIQISEKLFITESTVKKHISSILSKLEIGNRTEAALYAARLWRRDSDL